MAIKKTRLASYAWCFGSTFKNWPRSNTSFSRSLFDHKMHSQE